MAMECHLHWSVRMVFVAHSELTIKIDSPRPQRSICCTERNGQPLSSTALTASLDPKRGMGWGGRTFVAGGGAGTALWLAPPPPPKRAQLTPPPQILLRLTPGPGGDPDPKFGKK